MIMIRWWEAYKGEKRSRFFSSGSVESINQSIKMYQEVAIRKNEINILGEKKAEKSGRAWTLCDAAEWMQIYGDKWLAGRLDVSKICCLCLSGGPWNEFASETKQSAGQSWDLIIIILLLLIFVFLCASWLNFLSFIPIARTYDDDI